EIWLTPMPNRELSAVEREEMSATMVVAEDRKDVDPNVWTPAHTALIKAAAQDPVVARIFVNAAIKKALCRDAGSDRAWLSKVQPWWFHDYHFHVRINCPADSPDCNAAAATPGWRRLREGARSLVPRGGAPPQARAEAARTATGPEDGRAARCLPPSAGGAVAASCGSS